MSEKTVDSMQPLESVRIFCNVLYMPTPSSRAAQADIDQVMVVQRKREYMYYWMTPIPGLVGISGEPA